MKALVLVTVQHVKPETLCSLFLTWFVLASFGLAGTSQAAETDREGLLSQVVTERLNRPQDPQLMFVHAMLLTEAGAHMAAADLFRNMLSIDPALLRPRLELALVLLKAGDLDGSRYHFEQVLAHPLPDPVRTNVLQMLEHIREVRSYFSASFEIVVDSNPKQTTSTKEVEIDGVRYVLSDESRPQRSTGFRTTLNARFPVPGTEGVFIRGRLDHTEHEGRTLDLSYMQAAVGQNVRRKGATLGYDVGVHHSRFQHETLYRGFMATVTDQREWGQRTWVRSQAAALQLNYPQYRFRDGWQYSAAIQFIHSDSPSSRWEVDVSRVEMVTRERPYSFAMNQLGARKVQEFKGGWIFGLRTSANETKYKQNDIFFNELRRDRQIQVELQLSNRRIRLWRLTPQLQVNVTDNKSNIDFYTFRRNFIRLGMSGAF